MTLNLDLEEFTNDMKKESTEYLLNIWNSDYRENWDEEKLQVISEILLSRGEMITTPKNLDNIKVLTTTIIQTDQFQYLGIVSAEVVLGTGFLSELDSEIADIFGERSSRFQKKLDQARTIALKEMKEKVINMGGDMIIGVSVSYMNLRNNVLMVSVNGTAVKCNALPE